MVFNHLNVINGSQLKVIEANCQSPYIYVRFVISNKLKEILSKCLFSIFVAVFNPIFYTKTNIVHPKSMYIVYEAIRPMFWRVEDLLLYFFIMFFICHFSNFTVYEQLRISRL